MKFAAAGLVGCVLGCLLGLGFISLEACTARQVSKTEYDAQSHACVDIYKGDAPAQRSCLDYVRAKWTKAGAPAAAVDGGLSQ